MRKYFLGFSKLEAPRFQNLEQRNRLLGYSNVFAKIINLRHMLSQRKFMNNSQLYCILEAFNIFFFTKYQVFKPYLIIVDENKVKNLFAL